MEFFSLGGLAKAALIFGAAIRAPRPMSERAAGGVNSLGPAALPFALTPGVVDLVAEPMLPMPPEPVKPKPARCVVRKLTLPPKIAAKRFLEFMQANGWHGERPWTGKNGVWEFYLFHCHFEDLAPLPDNVFAEAFARLVSKRVARARIDGLPGRPTFYAIPEKPAEEAPKARQRAGSSRKRAA